MAKTRKAAKSARKMTATRKAAPARKARRAAARKTNGGEQTPEAAAYVETLIATGEAARLDEHGRLPAGATHKIVEDEEGRVKVVRRRFSMA